MIDKIYRKLLFYSVRKENYKLFFWLCDRFPNLSQKYDQWVEEMAEAGKRDYIMSTR